MKKCFKCNIEKPYIEFYKHKQMADGYLNKCKQCTKKDVHNHRDANIDKVRAYDRNRPNKAERAKQSGEYQKTGKGYKVHLESNQRYRSKFPERYKARTAVGNAVRDKRLIKPSYCEMCKKECKPHGHHNDYSKPLSVWWLCASCHSNFHTYMRELYRNLAHTGARNLFEDL